MFELSFILFLQKFQNPLFDLISIFLALFFESYVILAVSLGTYLILNKKKILSAVLSLFPAGLLVLALKNFVGRARPGLDLFSANLTHGTNSAMPSGHTALSFAFCVTLAYYYPKYRMQIIALAVLTAVSRIYLGIHYPTDVIIGIAIGIFSSIIVIFFDIRVGQIHEKINKARMYLFSK